MGNPLPRFEQRFHVWAVFVRMMNAGNGLSTFWAPVINLVNSQPPRHSRWRHALRSVLLWPGRSFSSFQYLSSAACRLSVSCSVGLPHSAHLELHLVFRPVNHGGGGISRPLVRTRTCESTPPHPRQLEQTAPKTSCIESKRDRVGRLPRLEHTGPFDSARLSLPFVAF